MTAAGQRAAGYPIRERGVGETLDLTFELIRKHARPLAVPAALLYPFEWAHTWVVLRGEAPGGWAVNSWGPGPAAAVAEELGYGPIELPTDLLSSLMGTFSEGLIALLIIDRCMGQPRSVGTLFFAVIRRAPALVGIGIIMYILLNIAVLLCFVPMFIVTAVFLIVVQACVVEGAGALGAFARSWRLMAGHRRRTIGLMLLMLLLMIPLMELSTALPNVWAAATATAFVRVCGIMAACVLSTVVYLSARSRREWLDIELYVQDVEGRSAVEAPL